MTMSIPPKMQHQPSGIRASYQRAVPFLLCCLTLVVFIACIRIQPIVYATGDDYVLDMIVHGGYGSSPSLILPYSLLPVSVPLGLLYSIAPKISWYPLFLAAGVVVSSAILANLLVKSAFSKGLKVGLVVTVIVIEVLFTTYFTFTMVSAFMCAAGAAAMLSNMLFEEDYKVQASDVGYALWCLLGFSLRPESGALAALIFLPIAIGVLVYRRKLQQVALLGILSVAIVLSYVGTQVSFKMVGGWSSFAENFSSVRTIVDGRKVSDTSEMQTVSGLSENDIELLYNFVFVDGQVYRPDVMERAASVVPGASVVNALDVVRQRPLLAVFSGGLFVLVAGVGAFLVGAVARAERYVELGRLRRGLMAICLVMMVCAFAYIFVRSRVKIRVLLSIFVCGMAVCAALVRKAEGKVQGRHMSGVQVVLPQENGPHIAKSRAFAGLAVALLGTCALCGYILLSYVSVGQDGSNNRLRSSVANYVDEHPQIGYTVVRDQAALVGGDIWQAGTWHLPKNVILIGSYEAMTPDWKTMLASAGLREDARFPLWLLEDSSQQVIATEKVAEEIRIYLEEHGDRTVAKRAEKDFGTSAWVGDNMYAWSYTNA